MTVLIILGSIAGILSVVINFLKYFNIAPKDLKKFITIYGRVLAWKAYLIFTIVFTIYFFIVLAVVFSSVSFSIGFVALLLLILWGLLGTWTPALRRLNNKRVDNVVNIVAICLMIVIVILFWFVMWPEIQQPIFVTLLLLAYIIVDEVNRFNKKGEKIAS